MPLGRFRFLFLVLLCLKHASKLLRIVIAMHLIAAVFVKCRESGFGYKQTSSRPKSTSALPPKADVSPTLADFRR